MHKDSHLKFFIANNFMRNRFDLHIGHRSNGQLYIAAPIQLSEVDEGVNITTGAPAASLSQAEAQELMDELWRAGIRPAQGAGSAGQQAATENHLQDMRKLAFHALKVPQS